MGLVVVVLLLALVVGRLCGGRLSRMADLELRRWPLVAAGLVLQLAGGLLGGAAYPCCLAASVVLVAVFLAGNRGLRGGPLIATGLLANVLVVVLNGAMPVSASAAARAGVPVPVAVADPRHELAVPGTRLRPLGDVVPVPLPWAREVVSPGDLLVAAGLAQLVLVAMTTGGRRTRPAARTHLPPIR